MQTSWLPVICSRTRPAPRTAAADFIGIDEASTHRWLCKGQGRHPMVPTTEWVCAHLAQACGLPVPPVAVVQADQFPGQDFFGSQWQGGSRSFAECLGRISNADVFARTHAVDLFVHNTDRHRDNFLYLDLAGEIVARVIDFSHALLVMGWPMPPLPLPPCNTMTELPLLLAQDTRAYARPDGILERVAALPNEWMRDTLAPMPQQWLAREQRMALREWWIGRTRADRLRAAQSALP